MFHLETFQSFVTARNTVFLVVANTFNNILRLQNTKNLCMLKKSCYKALQASGNVLNLLLTKTRQELELASELSVFVIRI